MAARKGTIVSEKDGASPVGLPFRYYSQRDWVSDASIAVAALEPPLVQVLAQARANEQAQATAAAVGGGAGGAKAAAGGSDGEAGGGADGAAHGEIGDGRSDESAVDRLFAAIDSNGDGKVRVVRRGVVG